MGTNTQKLQESAFRLLQKNAFQIKLSTKSKNCDKFKKHAELGECHHEIAKRLACRIIIKASSCKLTQAFQLWKKFNDAATCENKTDNICVIRMARQLEHLKEARIFSHWKKVHFERLMLRHRIVSKIFLNASCLKTSLGAAFTMWKVESKHGQWEKENVKRKEIRTVEWKKGHQLEWKATPKKRPEDPNPLSAKEMKAK